MPSATSAQVAAYLGEVELIDGLRRVQELTPKQIGTATPNTYSGNFGLEVFPLHTDLAHWSSPPRYFLLRCIVGDPAVATLVVDGQSLIEDIGLTNLARCLARPRRPLAGGLQLLPILDQPGSDERSLLRWDELYIRPTNSYSRRMFESIGSWLSAVEPTKITLVNSGDTLVVDNWRILHGRSPVSASHHDRLIHRVYLSRLK
jgi:L-asparagine oxygenase